MQRSMLRGLSGAIAAIVMIGLAACADSLPPVGPHAAAGSPTFDVSIDLGGVQICTPCPPDLVCAAVCQTSDPIPVPEVAGDTTTSEGTDAAVVLGPGAAPRTPTAPSDTTSR